MAHETTIDIQITDLKLPARVCKLLANSKINTLSELCDKHEFDLIRIKGLGRKSVNKVKEVIKRRGLSLQTTFIRIVSSPTLAAAEIKGLYKAILSETQSHQYDSLQQREAEETAIHLHNILLDIKNIENSSNEIGEIILNSRLKFRSARDEIIKLWKQSFFEYNVFSVNINDIYKHGYMRIPHQKDKVIHEGRNLKLRADFRHIISSPTLAAAEITRLHEDLLFARRGAKFAALRQRVAEELVKQLYNSIKEIKIDNNINYKIYDIISELQSKIIFEMNYGSTIDMQLDKYKEEWKQHYKLYGKNGYYSMSFCDQDVIQLIYADLDGRK